MRAPRGGEFSFALYTWSVRFLYNSICSGHWRTNTQQIHLKNYKGLSARVGRWLLVEHLLGLYFVARLAAAIGDALPRERLRCSCSYDPNYSLLLVFFPGRGLLHGCVRMVNPNSGCSLAIHRVRTWSLFQAGHGNYCEIAKANSAEFC